LKVTITITDIPGTEKVRVKVAPPIRDLRARDGYVSEFAAAWMVYSLTMLKKPITEATPRRKERKSS
jgi:hypothetical protein